MFFFQSEAPPRPPIVSWIGDVSCLPHVVLFLVCCFSIVFLGFTRFLLDFFGCLSIKGPLEILFILKLFFSRSKFRVFRFFRLWHVMLFLVLSVLCSWWRSLIGFQRGVFGSQGAQRQ